MNVAIIGEIKTKRDMGNFGDKDCGEVLTYGEKCLEFQPNRSEMIVFLTDCHIIQFFKIEKGDEGKKYISKQVSPMCALLMGIQEKESDNLRHC